MAETDDPNALAAHVAAAFQPDVGMEQVGAIYAKAWLNATQTSGQTASSLDEIDGIVGEVFEQFPKLETILGSLLVSPEEKTEILDRVFGGKLAPVTLNFLKVVSRHGRLDCLRAIHREAHRMVEESQGRIRVRLSTASPLDSAQLAQINQNLTASLGGVPILESVVDSELIGGAILRIGDTVYDGSVASQLQSIRQQMIDRSVHEIQSRRDSFRNPTGS